MTLRSLASTMLVCLLAAAPVQAEDLSGEWELTTMVFGQPLVERLNFKVENGKITGTSSGTAVTGSVDGNRIRFEYKDPDGTGMAVSDVEQRVIARSAATRNPGLDWL